mmetsp:Transcript_28962/g.40961  ORF Transcript_28962/g.40961 Transcript_28962/m.40961 type:complete len:340 (+) Transcript_28962:2-1021(+)
MKVLLKSLFLKMCMEMMPDGMVEVRKCDPTNSNQLFSLALMNMPEITDPCLMRRNILSFETFNDGNVSGWEDGRYSPNNGNVPSLLGLYRPGDQPRRVYKLPPDTLELHIGFKFFEIDTERSKIDPLSGSLGKLGDNGDDPLSVLINNVELDLKELVDKRDLSLGYVQSHWFQVEQDKSVKHKHRINGTTIGGIKWSIIKNKHENDHGLNKDRVDRSYDILFWGAPRILFDHTNQLDLRFLIKLEGKAAAYGFRDISIMTGSYNRRECFARKNQTEVLDLWTPWEKFRGEMEPFLQDEIRKDLMLEFFNKPNHCLQNVKPIVSVNLIQKREWKDAKPRC